MPPMEPISFVFADRATVPGFLGLDVQDELIAHILEVKPDKILLLCDKNAEALHGDYFKPLQPSVPAAPGETADGDESGCGDSGLPPVESYILPPGDECKSWDHLSALMRWAFDVGTTKKSLVLAFGGGALLNIAGLFASILYRGTKLMYVPTTLLAMHDVVTSLKTSICFDGRKNNIGSFYAPLKILIDVCFCSTLPRSELFSGIGELAKNAALMGGKHAEGFVAALSKESVDSAHGGSGEEFVLDRETLMGLLRLGIEAKMSVLKVDAYEKNSGMIFEYGHTVSHAIEKAYGDGVVPHGLGVTYGMLSSSFAAERMGIMTPEERSKHDELCWLLLKRWPLPEPKPTIEKVMALAMRDSKRGITSEADDEISDVLLRKMGDIVPTKTSMLSKFPCSLVAEWLASMGFPSAEGKPSVRKGRAVTDSQCEALLDSAGALDDEELVAQGFEPLTVGFANRVCATERRGQPLVIKRYTDLAFLRLTPEAIGAVDLLAGEAGVGPRVFHSSPRGLVMERLEGRTLEEADMHKGNLALLEAVAASLARLHQLPMPKVSKGEPMLWRAADKMMELAAQRPDVWPTGGMPGIGPVLVEVARAKQALAARQAKVVLGHGDFKPSNVILHEGSARIIDFELAGPNYRGFDLMKAFRTAKGFSEDSMRHFLGAYLAGTGEACAEEDVDALMTEARAFEPLTWLEAAVFFLALPQFKPQETARWHSLAVDRWAKFEETKGQLESVN